MAMRRGGIQIDRLPQRRGRASTGRRGRSSARQTSRQRRGPGDRSNRQMWGNRARRRNDAMGRPQPRQRGGGRYGRQMSRFGAMRRGGDPFASMLGGGYPRVGRPAVMPPVQPQGGYGAGALAPVGGPHPPLIRPDQPPPGMVTHQGPGSGLAAGGMAGDGFIGGALGNPFTQGAPPMAGGGQAWAGGSPTFQEGAGGDSFLGSLLIGRQAIGSPVAQAGGNAAGAPAPQAPQAPQGYASPQGPAPSARPTRGLGGAHGRVANPFRGAGGLV